MDDIDRILRVAKRYGVGVFLHPDFPHGYGESEHEEDGRNTRGLVPAAVSDKATSGPRWHCCDVGQKVVWLHNFDPDEPENILHEICHCIVNPPGGDIEKLSEDVVLMPFERVLARQTLSWYGYRRVVKWQHQTQIEWYDPVTEKYFGSLEDVPNYTRWGLWRESFRALRRMKAITRGGRVTWQWPDWNRAPKYIYDRGNLTGRETT